MSILSVKNLNVSLGGQRILEDISFELQKGESLAIIGPNGAGKTVLFRALLGFIPYTGKINWQPNIKIGYVPQKIDFDRYLPISLEDFLLAKARILGLSKKEIEKKLEAVGFSKILLKSNLGHLSFGQFQRALIAFALLGDPDVLLLDEATLGVDAPFETYIYEIIYRLQSKEKMTILLISHEFEVVYKYTDKVLCLNKKMLCFGLPEEALSEKSLATLYKDAAHYHHHHGTS